MHLEGKDMKLFVEKRDYCDVDIKCLGFMESFLNKYMKQMYAKSFNGGIDTITGAQWDRLIGDLYAVYTAKWKENPKSYQDMVDRTLPRYEDPLINAVNEL